MLPWMVVPFEMEMYDEVLRLWQSCEGIGLSAADERERIAAYLLRNPGCSFVVKANGTIAGALLAGHDGRRGYLHHLAVTKDCRRQGIAKSLVEAALAALKKAGVEKCHLFLFTDNSSGREFWQALGWQYRMDIAVVSHNLHSCC